MRSVLPSENLFTGCFPFPAGSMELEEMGKEMRVVYVGG